MPKSNLPLPQEAVQWYRALEGPIDAGVALHADHAARDVHSQLTQGLTPAGRAGLLRNAMEVRGNRARRMGDEQSGPRAEAFSGIRIPIGTTQMEIPSNKPASLPTYLTPNERLPMKRLRVVCSSTVATLLALSAGSVLSAVDPTPGTWVLYPPQVGVYSTVVQQPVNVDGSSNFKSNAKAVIPIKFDLTVAPGPVLFINRV